MTVDDVVDCVLVGVWLIDLAFAPFFRSFEIRYLLYRCWSCGYCIALCVCVRIFFCVLFSVLLIYVLIGSVFPSVQLAHFLVLVCCTGIV